MEWWYYLIVVVVWFGTICAADKYAWTEFNRDRSDVFNFQATYRNIILTFIFLLLLLITFKYLFTE